jgi:hypothetical protein
LRSCPLPTSAARSGNIALYKALQAQHPAPDLYLVIGPWFHHQQGLDGSAIGQIRFGSDTAEYFRLHVLRQFFALCGEYLFRQTLGLPEGDHQDIR